MALWLYSQLEHNPNSSLIFTVNLMIMLYPIYSVDAQIDQVINIIITTNLKLDILVVKLALLFSYHYFSNNDVYRILYFILFY